MLSVEQYGKVGVLYGGVSAERVISLESGTAILDSLRASGVNALAIDLGENPIDDIRRHQIDTAFIALHGGIGEDGRLQALLDFMGIPFTGSGMQASVTAMNKLICKQMWLGMGLPTPPFLTLDEHSDYAAVLSALGGGAMVKPAHEGSSIGMAIAKSADELTAAYSTALEYDACVFAEQLLAGEEYTVAILDREVLPPIKLKTSNTFYDYAAKYLADDTQYICPCGLDEGQQQQLKELALWAFDSLQCKGWGRTDLMVDNEGKFTVIEVNTVPGMTSHSLVPMAAKAAGYSFDELVLRILASANTS
ncbi:MAG: D-alanine--D-alanine ligase [Pseudomonadota bacterium]